MSSLYYGSGCCSVDGNLIAVEIVYKGKVHITDRSPATHQIIANNYKVIVFPVGEQTILTDLFDYVGEFGIKSVLGITSDKKVKDITIERQVHHPEYMYSNAEDMTLLSEEMNNDYVYKHKVGQVRVDNDVIKNQWSAGELYLKNGKPYTGYYHVHVSKNIAMTGKEHTDESKNLFIRKKTKPVRVIRKRR